MYFDTYARRPSLALTILMNEHSRRWTYNIKRLQSIASGVCGHYCCLFTVAKTAGWNLRRFIDLFSVTDLCKNDRLVVTLFKLHFGSCPRCTTRGVQTCVPALDIKGRTFIPLRENYNCPFVDLINSNCWGCTAACHDITPCAL
uniref:Uncharacterized protein n=1 Tax=Timema tahoe TaxID=61484 RepID=A0A7R9FMV4_9NEOP|nr:unnamed protein product [Timema tahoe]